MHALMPQTVNNVVMNTNVLNVLSHSTVQVESTLHYMCLKMGLHVFGCKHTRNFLQFSDYGSPMGPSTTSRICVHTAKQNYWGKRGREMLGNCETIQ